TRTLLLRRGYRVAMTRSGPVFRYGSGGNIARAQFCDRRHAALMLRIHADGSANASPHGFQTLYPAFHKGWTDDIYKRSLRAARLVQGAALRATGATNLGLVPRSDLTGFTGANVRAMLVECGYLSNPAERRLLRSNGYEWKIAGGLTAGVAAFVSARLRPPNLLCRSIGLLGGTAPTALLGEEVGHQQRAIRGHLWSPRNQMAVHVPNGLAEQADVYALGAEGPLHRAGEPPKQWAECDRVRGAEVGDRLDMPLRLDDQPAVCERRLDRMVDVPG